MPLRHRLLIANAVLVGTLVVLGLIVWIGVRSLRNAVTSAADEYEELRLVEQAISQVARAKSRLATDPPDLEKAAARVADALQCVGEFMAYQNLEEVATDSHQQQEQRLALQARENLLRQQQLLGSAGDQTGSAAAGAAALDAAIAALSDLATETDITEVRSAAAEHTIDAMLAVGLLAMLIVVGSIVTIGICYRSVLHPLSTLQAGVREIASGRFHERLPEAGAREFADLAHDFNVMAGELQVLYGDLEQKVREASRHLVRSERLASVGFLAAGVAHEINNPLGIVAGYAELAQRWMSERDEARRADIESALRVIQEEAFRCKEITEKLLSLSKPGETPMLRVNLSTLAMEVAEMVHGLRRYREHQIVLRSEPGSERPVLARAAEIKQVLINLIVNAMEAVQSPGGRVEIECRGGVGASEIEIADNGCGMSPAILERVFEPFFSARSNAAARGTGLGLSISHAIVQEHRGTLRAHSEGIGKGSRFTLSIPLAPEENVHAAG